MTRNETAWRKFSGKISENELLKQTPTSEVANAQQLPADLPRTLLAKARNKVF
jgi:hypothetical protein